MDYEEWKLGIYVASALGSTVGNMFSKKKHKYPEEPMMNNIIMTESERIQKVEEFFSGLKVMQKNFERSKKMDGAS